MMLNYTKSISIFLILQLAICFSSDMPGSKILEKAISRKLLVFATATGLMAYSLLDPDTWGMIAIVYVGGQSVIDTVKVYKHGG